MSTQEETSTPVPLSNESESVIKTEERVADTTTLTNANLEIKNEESKKCNLDNNSTSNNLNTDPYSYLNRDEFSSERFKIEITNLPSPIGYAEIKKFLLRLQLEAHKIKCIGKPINCIFVTFKCEENRQKAIQTLNNYKWKNKVLNSKVAKPMADPLVSKRNNRLQDDRNPKRIRLDESQPMNIRVKNAVMPLWEKSYEEQLAQKEQDLKNFLKKLGKSVSNLNQSLYNHMKDQRITHKGSCCELTPIKPSPVLNGYRNKCEFSVGLNSEERTVGFRVGSYKEGSSCVAEPLDCSIISDKMKNLAKSFQNYIQKSERGPFNAETHEGYWRGLTVRETTLGDLMAIVVFHSQTLSKEELDQEKLMLKEYFETGPGAECQVNSLWFQIYINRSGDQNQGNKIEFISGKESICEEILGLKFEISPEAFFQTNTKAAEVLYKTIAEEIGVNSDSTVLDICCGTGTIGLSMAKNVKQVIGVELCSSAIADANRNSKLNDISNCKFISGKAEDFIFEMLYPYTDSKDLVAILDPPRAGINNKVIKALRGCPAIKRLAYIACNPTGAFNNMIDLARPTSKSFRGDPFVPKKAIPVDLFPHTTHCELIVIFERFNPVAVKKDE